MSSKDKPPVSIRIRLKYPDVGTFVEKYATNISRGGMFIQSRVPQPVGTALRFEVVLQDDTPLLRGEGTVIWVKEYDAAHPTRVHGMGIRFTELDEASQLLLEQILSAKSEPRGRSQTQEVRALVSAAAPADQEEPLVDETEDDGTMVQGFATFEATPPDQVPADVALETAPADPALDLDTGETEEPPIDPTPTDSMPLAAPARVRPFDTNAPSEHSSSNRELAALAGALEAGGDGVSVALAMAEQVLTEICESAGFDEVRIAAAVGAARAHLPAGVDSTADELELLLTAAPLPAASFEEAQRGLAGHGVALRSLPAPAAAVAPTPPPTSHLVPPAPIAAASLATPAAAPVVSAITPPPEPEPEDERDFEFDPSLLQAAARTARAAKQERSSGSFDLSDGRGGTGEFAIGAKPASAPRLEPAPTPLAPTTPAPADPGWGKLQTATELLDHGSDHVLQDMAARAGRHEERSAGERADRILQSFVVPDDAPEEAAANELDPRLDHEALAEPEESATEPFLEPEAIDELSREIWKEVVDEAAEELDRLELPDGGPMAAGGEPSLEDEGGPTMLHDALFGEVRSSAAAPGEGRADLDLIASPGIGDDDLYEEDDLSGDSDSTQVTAMPVFANRAPRGRFVEADLDEAEPDTFATDREPDVLEPDTLEPDDPQDPSEIEDALPPDPDLSSEVFETLAGLRDTLRERQPGEPATETPRAQHPPDDLDGIPSLEALADAQPAPPPPSKPDAGEDLDQLEVVATDPDAPEPKPSIKPRRSGIFRRIFGKKE